MLGNFFMQNLISMTELIEQRHWINFFLKLGDSQTETIWNIQQDFRNEALSPTEIKEWFNRFKDGWMPVENKPRSGMPSTRWNEEVIEKVH